MVVSRSVVLDTRISRIGDQSVACNGFGGRMADRTRTQISLTRSQIIVKVTCFINVADNEHFGQVQGLPAHAHQFAFQKGNCSKTPTGAGTALVFE